MLRFEVAETKQKAVKAVVQRFAPMTAEQVSAGLAGMSFGVTKDTEIGRRTLRVSKMPAGASKLAEAKDRLSQREDELQASTANVKPRKSPGRPKKTPETADLPSIEAEPLLTQVLYHEVQEDQKAVRSVAKHGVLPAKLVESTKSVSIKQVREAVEAIPSKLSTNPSDVEFKTRMKKMGVTLHQFADLTGMPRRTIENWSRANNAPPIAHKVLGMWELAPDAVKLLLEALL
jgi:DNA-binding transcriptional regulator YiaG